MDFEQIKRVYFVGIGGIGMSALARYFVQRGKSVAGYDRTSSGITVDLENMGVAVHYTDDVNLIPGVGSAFDFQETNPFIVLFQGYGAAHGVKNKYLECVVSGLRQGDVNGYAMLEWKATGRPASIDAVDLEFRTRRGLSSQLNGDLGFNIRRAGNVIEG